MTEGNLKKTNSHARIRFIFDHNGGRVFLLHNRTH